MEEELVLSVLCSFNGEKARWMEAQQDLGALQSSHQARISPAASGYRTPT